MNFPERQDYDLFIRKLSSAVSERFPFTCFYLYGSYTRNDDFVPGRSDIDGGFIFDMEFITGRKEIGLLSTSLHTTLEEAEKRIGILPSNPGISVNFNLMDRGINRDGRFLAYDDSYTGYLKEHAIISSGPDFVKEMKGLNYKRESLRSAAYNLRKVRNGLLTYFLDLRKNPAKAQKSILSSIDNLWAMPKKLLESLGKEPEFERGAFFETFREIFPEYNDQSYRKSSELRANARSYYGVLSERNLAFNLATEILNATEEMIQAYVKRFPFPSELEMRSSSHSV